MNDHNNLTLGGVFSFSFAIRSKHFSILLIIVSAITTLLYSYGNPLFGDSCTDISNFDSRGYIFYIISLFVSCLIGWVVINGTYSFVNYKFDISDFVFFIFAVSVLFISAFSIVYSTFGIIDAYPVRQPPQGLQAISTSWWDYFYFSICNMVGYSNSEFRICKDGRPIQAIQIVIGAYIVPYMSAIIIALNLKKSQ